MTDWRYELEFLYGISGIDGSLADPDDPVILGYIHRLPPRTCIPNLSSLTTRA